MAGLVEVLVKRLGRLVAVATAVTVILAGISPAEATAGQQSWTVELTASTLGNTVKLSARPNQDVTRAHPYVLFIIDLTAGQTIRTCHRDAAGSERWANGECYISTSFSEGDPHTYQAFIAQGPISYSTTPADLTSIQAASAPVEPQVAPWAVTLTADRSALSVGETVKLSARPNQDVTHAYPYVLFIIDLTAGQTIRTCHRDAAGSERWANGECYISTSFSEGDPHTYQAFIAQGPISYSTTTTDLTSIQATSMPVHVQRQGWEVRLEAPATVAPGESFRLSAYPNQDITASPFRLFIIDLATNRTVRTCDSTSPSEAWVEWIDGECFIEMPPLGAQVHTFRAYIAKGANVFETGLDDLTDVQASSGSVAVPNVGGPTMPDETSGGRNPASQCNQCHRLDPINTATGEFWETTTDLAILNPGPGVTWSRSFGTLRSVDSGTLGYGWTHRYGMHLAPEGGSLTSAPWVSVVQENGSTVTFAADGAGGFSAPFRVMATLERAEDGTYRFTRKQTEVFLFDANGRLLELEDLNGSRVVLDYGGAGVLQTISDSRGSSLRLEWLEDKIASVTDHAGRAVKYTYSAAGDLTGVLLPDGSVKAYAYDGTHRVTSVAHPDGGVTRNEYDPGGRVIKQTDPLGHATTFAYIDGQTTITDPTGSRIIERYVDGQLASITIGVGTALEGTTSYTYGSTNHVESITDQLGRVTQFAYDTRGNRTNMADPLGRVSVTTFDAFSNPLVATNAAGESTSFTYDERGNPASMTDPTGAVTTFAVNPDGTVATSTDPLGRVTSYTYDAHGFVASVIGPDGAVVTTVHNTLGELVSSTDPRGAVARAEADDFTSTFTYDAAGRLLSTTDPLDAVVASAHDAAGRLTTVTDATGAVTKSEYDLAGQVTAVVDAAGNRTALTYDAVGRVTKVTDATGATTTTTYDALGRPTAVTDALGRVSRTEYDAGNRVIATVTPSGARTAYTYDAGDQLLTVTDPLGEVTTTAYDQAGRPVTVTDADGRKVTTSYDAAGRPVKVLRADGSALTWEYDATGQVTATVDASGARTTYTYDAAGRRASATDTAGRITTFGYDAAGLLTTLTQADGSVTTYTYDAVGRQIGTDYSDDTPDVSTAYDVAGRPTAVTDGTGATAYTYDLLGRVLEVANGDTTVGYAWDVLGRLTDLTYPTGEVIHRTFDVAGQLTVVTDWEDRDYTYTYDADGRTEQIAYPNDVVTSYDRDDAGQTLGITVAGNGIDLLELAYGYTDAGLLADQTTTRSTQSRAPPTTATTSSDFAWDALGRIEQITGDNAGAFTFDAAGSITALADGRTLTYDTARQLTTLATPATGTTPPTTTAYAYDARGNRATATTDSGPTAGTVGHTYDQANQLTSVTGLDGATTSYTHAATGLRAMATTGTAVEQYTWDTLAGIPLLLSDATHAYVYGNGSTPLAQVDLADASLDYLHTDALGSVRSTTDQAGMVTSDADYDAYGVPRAVTAVLCAAITRFGYAGEYTDPTGYLYLRARYYDPTTAQFLTVDPLVELTQAPYDYTEGNPLQYIDPLGLINWNVVATVAAAGAAVALLAACVATVICGVAATAGAASTALVLTASAGTVASVAAVGAIAAGGASVAVQQHEANTWFSRANDAQSRGTPRTNGAQNNEFKDAVKVAERQLRRKLDKDQIRELHDAITGRNYGFHDIVEEACYMFGG